MLFNSNTMITKNTNKLSKRDLDNKFKEYIPDIGLRDYIDSKLRKYPTKDYLIKSAHNILKQHLPNDYLEKKLENYPTIYDLKLALLPFSTNADLDNVIKKFDSMYSKSSNDTMQFKDDIISMFLELKTEIISMKALYNRHDEKIDTHKIRISNLESAKN